MRRGRGGDAFRSRFRDLSERDRPRAAKLLRSPGLSFGTLFLLVPELREFGLGEELDGEKRMALQMSGNLLRDGELQEAFGEAPVVSVAAIRGAGAASPPAGAEKVRAEHEALRWMFRTGARDDGLSDRYDQLLDAAAATLIKLYGDRDLLPRVAELIFRRAHKGMFYHDLAWAFFQSRDPEALLLLARRLHAKDRGEAELARTLLNLPEGQQGEKAYRDFKAWHRENSPYLAFRPGGFQLSGTPDLYGVDYEAKYLGKPRKEHEEKEAEKPPLTQREYGCLCRFRERSEAERQHLAGYSARLRRRSSARWRRFMDAPVESQLEELEKLERGAP